MNTTTATHVAARASQRMIGYAVVAILCIGSILLVYPTIKQNTEDPNLIVYFDHDEGLLMDLAWYYYSGQTRESFQYDCDYGLELWYLADLAHLIPSGVMTFTPGTFVRILRWLHLLAWVAALLALWHFMRYHFGGIGGALLATSLLATNPAFSYLFSSNLKPDPIVLLLIIIGLHYTLRMMEDRSRRYLLYAVACAAASFTIKYLGVFLLPPIVCALFLASRREGETKPMLPRLKVAWILPGLCGIFCIAMGLSTICVYKRRLSGLTWCAEAGLWQSLAQNKLVLYIILFGVFLIGLSMVFRLMNLKRAGRLKRIADIFNEINSYSLFVLGLFMLFLLFFGCRWIRHPQHFISIYAQAGRDGFGYQTEAFHPMAIGSIISLGSFFISKIKDFNPVISVLFIMYLVIEGIMRHTNFAKDRSSLFKRVILLCFLLPFFPYMFSGGRATPHIMLPFFVVAVVLSLQGIKMLYSLLNRRAYLRGVAMACIFISLTMNVLGNGKATIDYFLYKYRQSEDVVFDIVKWFRMTYPADTSIVADHPTLVYLPPDYRNVRFLKFQYDRATQLRQLISSFKPRLVYLDTGVRDNMKLPPLEKIVTDIRVRLVASFDNKGKYYKRRPGARYDIYEIEY